MKHGLGFRRQLLVLATLFLIGLMLPQSSWADKSKLCNSYWQEQMTKIKIQKLETLVVQLEIKNTWEWFISCRNDSDEKKAMYVQARELLEDLRTWHDACYVLITPREVMYKLWDRMMPAQRDLSTYKDVCMK